MTEILQRKQELQLLHYYKYLPLSLMGAEDKRDIMHCAMYEINCETMTSSVVEQTVTEAEGR